MKKWSAVVRKGPLAISYVHGLGVHRTPDRFDYLMVSDELDVLEITYFCRCRRR